MLYRSAEVLVVPFLSTTLQSRRKSCRSVKRNLPANKARPDDFIARHGAQAAIAVRDSASSSRKLRGAFSTAGFAQGIKRADIAPVDVSQACRERGIKTVAVSAGYISFWPVRVLRRLRHWVICAR
jgi:hypothetical protein